MHTFQKRNRSIYSIGWLICLLCFLLLFAVSSCMGQGQSIGLDVSPMIVESNQNFSVSVYDSSIQNGTPYLVDVTILFNDVYYTISSENEDGELILTAPEVIVNRTYQIIAYYENQSVNTSILIIPSSNTTLNDLVITADTYAIEAYDEFSILITDKNGKPIENVLVVIEQSPVSQGSGITDRFGKVVLIAPNTDTITIRAEKQGYEPVEKTMNVIVKNDMLHQILAHPFTPIMLSLIVLIGVICFVSISNMKKRKRSNDKVNTDYHSVDRISAQERHNLLSTSRSILSNHTRQKTPQIEEILIQKSPTKKITHIEEIQPKIPRSSHRWFHMQDKKQKEKADEQKAHSSEPWIQSTEEIHRKIDAVLAEKENKSKRPFI
jgi:hypothetical protein